VIEHLNAVIKVFKIFAYPLPESPEAALAANVAGLRHHQFRAPFTELANKSNDLVQSFLHPARKVKYSA